MICEGFTSINSTKLSSIIKLPKGINWLQNCANFSNELYMRLCYFDLLEAKQEYFKLNKKLNTVIYIGTPEIDKSYFCAYVVTVKSYYMVLLSSSKGDQIQKQELKRPSFIGWI